MQLKYSKGYELISQIFLRVKKFTALLVLFNMIPTCAKKLASSNKVILIIIIIINIKTSNLQIEF